MLHPGETGFSAQTEGEPTAQTCHKAHSGRSNARTENPTQEGEPLQMRSVGLIGRERAVHVGQIGGTWLPIRRWLRLGFFSPPENIG